MEHIIYRITYLPHLKLNFNPKFYAGSKYAYQGNYFGSPASKQIFDYTEGLSLQKWWKSRNKNDFQIEILEICNENITPQDLVLREYEWHLKLNVLSDEYFNQSLATKGYVSSKKSEQTRILMSKKTLEYWNTIDGLEKRNRLKLRNETSHSFNMLERWKNPTNKMINRKIVGRTKGANDLKPRKQREMRKVINNGRIFDNAFEASKVMGLVSGSIRRLARKKLNGWSYVCQ